MKRILILLILSLVISCGKKHSSQIHISSGHSIYDKVDSRVFIKGPPIAIFSIIPNYNIIEETEDYIEFDSIKLEDQKTLCENVQHKQEIAISHCTAFPLLPT